MSFLFSGAPPFSSTSAPIKVSNGAFGGYTSGAPKGSNGALYGAPLLSEIVMAHQMCAITIS